MKKLITYYLLLCTIVMTNTIACSKSDSTPEAVITPPAGGCAGTPGMLFTAMKTIIVQRCVSCHNSTNAQGGQDLSTDCKIIASKTRIKVRAVDEGTMPPNGPLPQADKDKITAWINAGGLYTN